MTPKKRIFKQIIKRYEKDLLLSTHHNLIDNGLKYDHVKNKKSDDEDMETDHNETQSTMPESG